MSVYCLCREVGRKLLSCSCVNVYFGLMLYRVKGAKFGVIPGCVGRSGEEGTVVSSLPRFACLRCPVSPLCLLTLRAVVNMP